MIGSNRMGDLTRTGVAIDSDLLSRFDRFIDEAGLQQPFRSVPGSDS